MNNFGTKIMESFSSVAVEFPCCYFIFLYVLHKLLFCHKRGLFSNVIVNTSVWI